MAPDMEVTFYTCASKQSHHEVVTEKSVSAVYDNYFWIQDLVRNSQFQSSPEDGNCDI